MGQNDANILTMSVTVVRRDNYHDDVCNSVYILYVYIYDEDATIICSTSQRQKVSLFIHVKVN